MSTEGKSNDAAASGGSSKLPGKDSSAPAPFDKEVLSQKLEALAAKQGDDSRLEGQGARADEPRVNPVSGGSAPVNDPKPLANTEPANVSNDRASDPIDSEGKKVAQQFYSMNASEILDLAVEGYSHLKPKLQEAWSLADLSGANIVDQMRLQCLYAALEEIEQASNFKIPFSFQRHRVIRNIVASLAKDTSIDEDVRDGWMDDMAEMVAIIDADTRRAVPKINCHDSEGSPAPKKRVEATQIFTDDEDSKHSAKAKKADFRDEFRMKFQSTILPSSSLDSAAKGSVLAELADGTKIYAAPERSDIAPQILNYPLLTEMTPPMWKEFLKMYRRVDLKARRQNKVPISQCVDPDLVPSLCRKTELDVSKWHDLPNNDIILAMCKLTGPKNATQAKDDLKHDVFFFDDREQHQDKFASKLSKFIREKETLLGDITVSADMWADPKSLTKKMIVEALNHCFTDEGKYVQYGVEKLINSNNPKIREIIRDNQDHKTSEILAIVVDHFEEIDQNVQNKKGQYHVFPFLKKNAKRGRENVDPNGRGGGRSGNFGNGNRNTPDRRERFSRGVCGKTDHECTAETCLIFGEPEAKPAGYVWAIGEPNVWLTQARLAELQTKKPSIKSHSPKTDNHFGNRGGYSRGGGGFRGGGGHRGGGGFRGGGGHRGGGNHRGGGFTGGGYGRGGGGYRGGGGANNRGGGYARGGRGANTNDRVSVNERRYSTLAYNGDMHEAGDTGIEVQMNDSDLLGTFHASARITREKSSRAPRCVRAHMDNGAQMNLLRTSLLLPETRAAMKVLDRKSDRIVIQTNGVVIGESLEAVLIEFTLDTQQNVATITYREWFSLFDNLKEEMVLGGEFMERQGFTTMHKTLVRLKKYNHPERKTKEEDDDDVEDIPYEQIENKEERPDRDGWGFEPGYTNAAEAERLKKKLPDDEKLLLDEDEVAECPAMRRSRVITRTEKLQRAADDCCTPHKPSSPVSYKPGTSTPIVRGIRGHGLQHYPLPENVRGKTPKHDDKAPLRYDMKESKRLAQMVASKFHADQTNIEYRLLGAYSASQRMSENELESMLDATKLIQKEANAFYYDNAYLLDPKYEKPSYSKPGHKRFFEDSMPPLAKQKVQTVTSDPEESAQKFGYGHTAVLTNLKNYTALNDIPVRVLNFDKDTSKYTISVASMSAKPEHRGYWLVAEHNLRTHEQPKKQRTGPATVGDCDYGDIGIDRETGQPTLDPVERPVHRQFGKAYSDSLTAKIKELIAKYKEVFSTDIRTPCKFNPMKIELKPNAVLPRNPRFWKNSPAMREEVRAQLQKMISAGIVQHSNTAIVSNVLMVKRPGMPGKYRFTIDFRDVNAATVPQKWQMPDVNNQLERLKGNKIFGALDISQYYHQIELDKSSRYLTGFITEDGVYEYKRVPMGLTNACSHAQSELQKKIDNDPILSKYNVRNYFDDIPIAAKTEEEFLEVLEALLKLCQNEGLKLNEEKSVFGVTSITHVGFIVDGDSVTVDPMRTQSFREMTTPTSIKKVQAVLGAMNYVRHFIPNFSTRAMPLTAMLGKGKEKARFVWTTSANDAFEDLKKAVLETAPLAFIDYTKEIFIRCDSSQFGAGAVLFQFDEEGRECPVAYASRKYTLAERNYNTFQQEAAVIVWSLEKFAEYFQGHPVTVQSDHRNLSWVKRSTMPQLTRWRLRLQDFDFKIEYLPGPLNVCSDGLSRLEVDDKDLMITMGDFLPTHAAAASLLHNNVKVRELAERMSTRYGDRITHRDKTASEKIWEQGVVAPVENEADCEDCEVEPCPQSDDHHPGRFDEEGVEIHAGHEEPVVPPILPDLSSLDGGIAEIISHHHSDIVGHAGVYVTLQRILRSERGWADRAAMLRDIDTFLSGCVTCQKFRKRRTQGGTHRFIIEGTPFAEMSIDLLKLPRADCRNNKYVVVLVDNFSRWTHCVPVEDKTAESAARALIQTVGIFGCPLKIRSDGGGEFINDVLAGVELLLGTKHHKVTPYLHTGNSLAEKANRAVLENLRNIIFDKRLQLHGEHQWGDILPLAQRIINASFNSSIGCSPSQILFGDNVDLDRYLLNRPAPPIAADATEYVKQLSHNQQVIIEAAEAHLHATQAANLKKWKQTHKSSLSMAKAVEEGAWVLARYADDAPRSKLKPKWRGPFRLLDFKSETQSIVRLWDTVAEKIIECHLNDVELWNPLFEESTEGLTKVAEYDNWSYPIESILGLALIPTDEDAEPTPLPLDAPRTSAKKHDYLFSIKWKNYNEPSWVPYRDVKCSSSFALFAAAHPVLKLS